MLSPSSPWFYHGVHLTDRPDLANISRLDHLVIPMVTRMQGRGFLIDDFFNRIELRRMTLWLPVREPQGPELVEGQLRCARLSIIGNVPLVSPIERRIVA